MGIKLKYISTRLKLIQLTSVKYNYTLYLQPSFLPLAVHNYFLESLGKEKSRHDGQHWIKNLKHSEKNMEILDTQREHRKEIIYSYVFVEQ